MKRRSITQAMLASLAIPYSQPIWAQGAALKLTVGFAAGGSVDLTARALADAMRESLGRSVLVENRPGASGRLAPESVRLARPDGDSLMLVPHGPMTLFQWLHRQLRYDPVKDFTPIGRVCVVDYALTTGPASSAKTMAEYLQWAKDPAHKAAYGSPGAGTIPHFIGQGLVQKTKTDIVHVPYKGAAPIDRGDYPYATCHVQNLSHAILLALWSEVSGAFFLTDGEDITLRDFLTQRLLASGLQAPRMSVPAKAAWLLGGAMEKLWGTGWMPGDPPLTRELVRLIGYPFSLDISKAKSVLGYAPEITIAQGMSLCKK